MDPLDYVHIDNQYHYEKRIQVYNKTCENQYKKLN